MTTETLIPVDSTAINAVGWENGTLYVEFNSGKVYAHPSVPYSVYEGLMGAESKGGFYNQNIRGKYK